jgi:hypothetical protein
MRPKVWIVLLVSGTLALGIGSCLQRVGAIIGASFF